MRPALVVFTLGVVLALTACGSSPWEEAIDTNPDAADIALAEAYNQENFIDHYNEVGDRYGRIEDCERAQNQLEIDAGFLLIVDERLANGERLNSIGGDLTDNYDELLAEVLAGTLRAAELGC